MGKYRLAAGLAALLWLIPLTVSSDDDLWSEKVSCCLKGCS